MAIYIYHDCKINGKGKEIIGLLFVLTGLLSTAGSAAALASTDVFKFTMKIAKVVITTFCTSYNSQRVHLVR